MMPGAQELIIILVIVVLLFGSKKIPDLAKGIGKGIKNFKNEMKEDEVVAADEPKKVETETTTAATTEAPKSTTQA